VPSPSTSDVAFLAALVCLGGVVRSYLPATADRSALRRILVDGLLLWLASFTVGWVLFIERALEQGQGMSGLARGVLVAYPVGDVLLLTMVALAMRHGLARDRSVQVLAAALASYVLADFGWNVAAVHGGYEPGSGPFDAGWVLTYGLLAAFPWVTTTHRRADASLRSASFSWSVRPVVLSGAAVLLLLAFSYRGVETADVALVALLVTATSLRHVLLTRDFLGLTQSLEREVAERTADLRTSRDRMRHLALHDSLTGLANRRMLIDRLTDATGPPGTSVRGALLLLDLDDFKTVNDTMGHPMGDRLLVVVAERLKDASRSDDLVARLGGDEFAVLMRDVGPVTAREVAARLLASVHEPVALVPGRRVQPHASLGLAMLQPGLEATDLMVRADLAMYAAKRDGRHSVVMYGPGAHSA
jgi:diguanylate cyclase (GGDEF)-like protein